MHRITDAEIAPAMASRAGVHDFEAAAAEGFGGDVVRGRAIEDQKGADALYQFGLTAEIPDSTQIPFTLFTDVCDKPQPVPDIGHATAFFRTKPRR